MPNVIDLPALLELLGYVDGEFFQLCEQPPGQVFRSHVLDHADARTITTHQDRNVWFGISPTTGPSRANAGRGGAADVTRLAAIHVDLDVKVGGCPTLEVAMLVVADLSEALGTRPAAVTFSGHGVQPLWPIEDGLIGDGFTTPRAAALLRRWGRLVANVADRRQCGVDSLYDLPRVLRAPGSVNWKHPAVPVQAAAYAEGGAPITIAHLVEVLREYDIPEMPDDGTDPGVVVSAPAEWEWREHTCKYVTEMIAGWATETPTARHPWLASQATRLASAHRNSCLAAADHLAGEQSLADRFRTLAADTGDRRGATPGEIRGALNWGIERASTFSPARAAKELGEHVHTEQPMDVPWLNAPHLPAVAQATPPPGPDPPTPPDDVEPPANTERLTDDGNANALIERHGVGIRYCHEKGRWLTWTGHRWRWEPSGGGTVREYAKDTARRIHPGTKPARLWRNRSLSAMGTSSTLVQAATDNRVVVDLDQLDSDPWVLNTPGGVVDLRTGTLHAPTAAALHTRATAHTPDPAAPQEAWRAFLSTTFGGDLELIGYLQRLVGYSATGYIGPHILPFAHGSGGNGKGAFLEAVTKVLGDYATAAPNAFLMAQNYSPHETEIARLAGARMVLCSEVNGTDKFDEAKVKRLTGGDTLTARFMRQDHFTFAPTHHLWLLGNDKPAVTSGGRAFWRRCRLIPFLHEVPDNLIIDDLQGILARDHGPAILAWIVQGAVDYHRGGLREPNSVTDATLEYAHDQDTVGRFVEEMCRRSTSDVLKVETSVLGGAYEKWCAAEGETPVTGKRFGTELRNRFQVKDVRTHGRRWHTGIALIEPDQGGPADHTEPPSRPDPTTSGELFRLREWGTR